MLLRIFEIYSIGCRLITLRSSFYKLGIDFVMGGKALIYKNRAVSDGSPVRAIYLNYEYLGFREIYPISCS